MAPKDYLCQKLGVLEGRKRSESLSTLHVAQLARVRGQLAGVGSPTTRVCAALGLNSSRQLGCQRLYPLRHLFAVTVILRRGLTV